MMLMSSWPLVCMLWLSEIAVGSATSVLVWQHMHVHRHWANQYQHWPCNARHREGQLLEFQFWSYWHDLTQKNPHGESGSGIQVCHYQGGCLCLNVHFLHWVRVSANKIKAQINAISSLSNLIAELSLRVMLHVVCTQCVVCDLHIGHLSILNGDSLQHSEEIVKVLTRPFQFQFQFQLKMAS